DRLAALGQLLLDRRLVAGIRDANELNLERIVLFHALAHHPRKHDWGIGIVQDVGIYWLVAWSEAACVLDDFHAGVNMDRRHIYALVIDDEREWDIVWLNPSKCSFPCKQLPFGERVHIIVVN